MPGFSRIGFSLACLLSGLAGYVDAIGFLQLGGLFVSFISGNSTRLGIEIWRGDWHEAGHLASGILLFLIGAAVGSLVGGETRRTWVLVAVAILLTIAAALAGARPLLGGGALALAMGAENAVFQRRGGAGIGLTYMTGALVKAGQGIAVMLTGGPRWDWVPNVALWLALVVGAAAGGAAFLATGPEATWGAAALAWLLAPALWLAARRGYV